MSSRIPYAEITHQEYVVDVTEKESVKVQTEQDQEAFTAAVAPGKTEMVSELAARRIVVTLNRKQRRAVQAERRTGLSLVAALKKLNLLKLTA